MTDPITFLGSSPLFLGVQTQVWTLADFQQAAKSARALGVTSLLIKIADGGNLWYGSLGGWQKVLSSVQQAGMKAVPYTYCYGDFYGAIQSEIAILTSAMQQCGIVVGDLEVEYNGHADWAQRLCTALKPVPGLFAVTSWADPVQQNWTGVLTALAPCVNCWLPQVYTDWLATVYKAQYAPYGLPCYPVVDLGTDMGPNDPVAIAKASDSPIIGFWEYQAAISSYAPVVRQIIPSPVTQTGASMIPTGWHDNGTVLTAPNGVTVRTGFRDYVLNHSWDPNNYPLANEVGLTQLEISNPALGGGTMQVFKWTVLEWTASRGVFVQWSGQELVALRQKYSELSTQNTALQSQIQQLQAQLAATQNGQAQAALHQIFTLAQAFEGK